VIKASAKTGDGIKEIAKSIEKMLLIKGENYKARQRKMLEIELKDIILDMLEDRVTSNLLKDKRYQEYIEKMTNKEIDPYLAAEELADKILM
jgi:putative protein kinase ArgK-like GTPase of G3E family